jgi:hypothetical protein
MTPLRPGFAAELDPLRARRLLALVTSVLALVAAACSSGDSDQASDASVRPFAEVQDSELSFEVDPNDPITVQGSDAEGNLYKSELLSVTILDTGSAVFPLGSDTFTPSDVRRRWPLGRGADHDRPSGHGR